MSNDLDRLRELAGTGAPQSTENITGNMYELRDMLNEAAKPDFADIDGNGDKEKTDEAYDHLDEMSQFIKIAETTSLTYGVFRTGGSLSDINNGSALIKKFNNKDEAHKYANRLRKQLSPGEKSYYKLSYDVKPITEWANSPGNQYEDRGHYSEQPDGETVDLSLRRYLDAEPHLVKVVEDHTEDGMLKEYKEFKDE